MEMKKRQNENLEFEKKKVDWNVEKKKMLDEIFEVTIKNKRKKERKIYNEHKKRKKKSFIY